MATSRLPDHLGVTLDHEGVGRAERADGGYRVTGEKRFGSGCPAGDIAITSAPYDDPETGPSSTSHVRSGVWMRGTQD